MAAPLALAPAGLDWSPPDAAAGLDARLLRGPAYDRPLAQDEPDAWSHYRGNASPTEVVAIEAKPAGKELGRVKVPGKILRNSLAVSGGRVFAVNDSGAVLCLAAK
jgi:hypothetical protein